MVSGMDGKSVSEQKNNEQGDCDDGAVLEALEMIAQWYVPQKGW